MSSREQCDTRKRNHEAGCAVFLYVISTLGASTQGGVIYVDQNASEAVHDGTSWCRAYLELQDALVIARSGDIVRVAKGTYKPDRGAAQNRGDRNATFRLTNGVRIEGGYAGCTNPDPNARDLGTYEVILSGDLASNDNPHPASNCCSPHGSIFCDAPACAAAVCKEEPRCCDTLWDEYCASLAVSILGCCSTCGDVCDNSRHVVSAVDGSTGTLDGLTISDGFADGICCIDGVGGGLYIDGASPTLQDCRITNNRAQGGGGGVAVLDSELSRFSRTEISQNQTAGHGGGMFIQAPARVQDCMLTGNMAGVYGGAVYNGDAASDFVNDVVVANSSAYNGGGLYLQNITAPTIVNCTIVANDARAHGGGLVSEYGTHTIYNSIIWGNTSDGRTNSAATAQLYKSFAGNFIVRFSCVQDAQPGDSTVYPGLGNIDADPLFVRPCIMSQASCLSLPDLRPTWRSPCIDAGNNSAVPTWVTTDRDGQTRFFDDPATPDRGFCGSPCLHPIVDMGAYEFVQVLDCNGNGIPDWQEVRDGTARDCNGNGVPDECDIVVSLLGLQVSKDCNANGVPDECDLGDGTSLDCQPNQIPDECDIASGLSHDCVGLSGSTGLEDGIPDECQPDPLGTIISRWVDAEGGWNTAANWCPDLVPDNNENATFNVTVQGPEALVSLDISPTVTRVSLLSGGTVVVGDKSGANVRTLSADERITNQGFLRATDRERLVLDTPIIDQGGVCSGGVLEAQDGVGSAGESSDKSILEINGARVLGGTARTIGDHSEIHLIGGAELIGTCILGVVIPNGQNGGFRGVITNDATTIVAGVEAQTSFVPTVAVANLAQLQGGGSVRLLSRQYSQLGRPKSAFTNGSQHSIEGAGIVTGGLTNNGIVRGNVPSDELVISAPGRKINNNLIHAADGGTLRIADDVEGAGNLFAEGGVIRILPTEGLTVISATNLTVEGAAGRPGVLTLGNNSILSALQLNIGLGGAMRADREALDGLNIPASVQVGNVDLHSGGMSLTQSMSMTVVSALLIRPDKGSGVPPPCRAYDATQVRVGGDLRINDMGGVSADITYRSSEPLMLDGDFENESRDPLRFDWLAGAMTLNGVGAKYFEVAGINLGPTQDGFQVGTQIGCTGVHSNFAMKKLELSRSAVVHFENTFDNSVNPNDPGGLSEALYIGSLVLQPGSRFSIGENTFVYYVGLVGSIAEACTDGCGQIQAIPCAGPPEACVPPSADCPLWDCVSDPGSPIPPACRVHDRDADSDVDLFDFALMSNRPDLWWGQP